MEYDAADGSLAITNRDNVNEKNRLVWTQLDEESAILKGGFSNDVLVVKLSQPPRPRMPAVVRAHLTASPPGVKTARSERTPSREELR